MNERPMTATEAAELQRHEETFIAQCRDWSLAVAAWTMKAKALRDEREALDKALSEHNSRMTMSLMKLGAPLPQAELMVEAMLEKAFAR